jgi:menaquinone-dependent protoporphyrinogen oxidase
MRVLVTAASRHGSTAEIADRVADALRRGLGGGAEVDVRAPREVGDVTGYDAVVVGSAVYVGHWLDDARKLVLSHTADLLDRPVWLFSSGPVGDPPKPAGDTVVLDEVTAACEPREHRVFPGRIDRHRLHLAERAVVAALRVPDGDYRDWAAVEAWAEGIARQLRQAGPAARTTERAAGEER